MRKYCLYWNFNTTLLVGMITLLPNIFSLENKRFQQQQRYDYIDVAKETASDLSKGLTTRIFTTENGLDEKFWLKYLGEDFHDAVHLRVDNNNNVVPIENKRPQRQQLKLNTINENHLRVVRQPKENYKQLPVEKLYNKQNENQYPTEKPEIFKINSNKNFRPKTLHEYTSTNNLNNRKISQHQNQLLINDKNKQKIIKLEPSESLKAMQEPIIVNLPEVENCEYQINEDNVPVVVQLPPIIYHQKADLYSENVSNLQYFMHKNNLNSNSIPDSDSVSIPRDSALQDDNQQSQSHLYSNSIQNTPKYTTHSLDTHSNSYSREQQYEHHPLPSQHTEYYTRNQMNQAHSYQTHPSFPMAPSTFEIR